ncbi:MAG: PorT family protein [Flavobacteriaceae bacterium]|nr:PorT family protein [Candidatus Onthonaster equi]
MRKLYTFIILMIGILSTSIQAQTLHYGIKAGYNAANIGGDVDNSKTLSAFHVGLLVEVALSDQFSLQPEVLYSAQGAKFNSNRESNIDYVNVPILVKYYFIDGFSVEAGPQIGFLTKSEDKLNGQTIDYKDETKGVDFSIPVGLSYRFPINIFASLRYAFGLSNFNDLESSNYKMNHQVFQASVGYRF